MTTLAKILSGKELSAIIQSALQRKLETYCSAGLRAPTLAVVRVGEDPASIVYVNNKIKTSKACGFSTDIHILPEDCLETELLELIHALNGQQNIDGILVQLPLPNHINAQTIIQSILPEKDVDGFHPYNLGRLAQGNPALRPCTPYGIIQLLQHYQIDLRGKHAVIVGASNIVGRPMALELLMAGATVTICHRSTTSLESHIRVADIIVSATGNYNIISSKWLNQNQIVIDVGIHRGHDGKIHGDIHFDEAIQKVAYLTPVPGGVGPMTICALLQNTLSVFEKSLKNRADDA